MKLRTHTLALPTDYVSELRNKGERKKSRCFIEYFYDMEVGEHNSYGFYAKSWDVGKGTAHRWVKDFDTALEIFDAARELRRKTHYEKASAEFCKKYDGTNGTISVERLEHIQEPILSNVQETNGTNGTNGVEQSFININNKENKSAFMDKDFLKFITEIKMVIKNVGNTNTIYQSYLKVKDLIDLKVLAKIYRQYSNETDSSNKVGLSKFIDDLMFMSYCKPFIKVLVDSQSYEGEYDKDKELLITKEKNLKLTFDRYSELNSSNSIQVIRYIA